MCSLSPLAVASYQHVTTNELWLVHIVLLPSFRCRLIEPIADIQLLEFLEQGHPVQFRPLDRLQFAGQDPREWTTKGRFEDGNGGLVVGIVGCKVQVLQGLLHIALHR